MSFWKDLFYICIHFHLVDGQWICIFFRSRAPVFGQRPQSQVAKRFISNYRWDVCLFWDLFCCWLDSFNNRDILGSKTFGFTCSVWTFGGAVIKESKTIIIGTLSGSTTGSFICSCISFCRWDLLKSCGRCICRGDGQKTGESSFTSTFWFLMTAFGNLGMRPRACNAWFRGQNSATWFAIFMFFFLIPLLKSFHCVFKFDNDQVESPNFCLEDVSFSWIYFNRRAREWLASFDTCLYKFKFFCDLVNVCLHNARSFRNKTSQIRNLTKAKDFNLSFNRNLDQS